MKLKFETYDWLDSKTSNPPLAEEFRIRAAVAETPSYTSLTAGDGELTVEFDRNGTFYYTIQPEADEAPTELENPNSVSVTTSAPEVINIEELVEGDSYTVYWYFVEEYGLYRTPNSGVSDFDFVS